MSESTSDLPNWIDEVESRALAALPGPWVSFVEGRDHVAGDTFIRTGGGDGADLYVGVSGPEGSKLGWSAAVNDFVAAARQDIPALIEEVRRLRRSVQELRGTRDETLLQFDSSAGSETVRAFVDDNDSAVMVKVIAAGGDPVELSAAEARSLASALLGLAATLDEADLRL